MSHIEALLGRCISKPQSVLVADLHSAEGHAHSRRNIDGLYESLCARACLLVRQPCHRWAVRHSDGVSMLQLQRTWRVILFASCHVLRATPKQCCLISPQVTNSLTSTAPNHLQARCPLCKICARALARIQQQARKMLARKRSLSSLIHAVPSGMSLKATLPSSTTAIPGWLRSCRLCGCIKSCVQPGCSTSALQRSVI